MRKAELRCAFAPRNGPNLCTDRSAGYSGATCPPHHRLPGRAVLRWEGEEEVNGLVQSWAERFRILFEAIHRWLVGLSRKPDMGVLPRFPALQGPMILVT